jgi:glycine cleavage system H protein
VENPEIINKSPYEEGWFMKVKMDDISELDVLFSYDEYKDFLGEE